MTSTRTYPAEVSTFYSALDGDMISPRIRTEQDGETDPIDGSTGWTIHHRARRDMSLSEHDDVVNVLTDAARRQYGPHVIVRDVRTNGLGTYYAVVIVDTFTPPEVRDTDRATLSQDLRVGDALRVTDSTTGLDSVTISGLRWNDHGTFLYIEYDNGMTGGARVDEIRYVVPADMSTPSDSADPRIGLPADVPERAHHGDRWRDHAYKAGHSAGYAGNAPIPGRYDRARWLAGYRDGWALAVKYGAIVSPTLPPEPHGNDA